LAPQQVYKPNSVPRAPREGAKHTRNFSHCVAYAKQTQKI